MQRLRLGLLLALILPAAVTRAESDSPTRGFWDDLVSARARWTLSEAGPDAGPTPGTIVIETYDVRAVAGARVARLRWTYRKGAGATDIGDSDVGRYTQLAVTAGGLYVLSADMDDAAVGKALQRSPSRSDPPRPYKGTPQNQGRYLRMLEGMRGQIACLGRGPFPSGPACGVGCAGEVCLSSVEGFVWLDGAFAPGGRTFAGGEDSRPGEPPSAVAATLGIMVNPASVAAHAVFPLRVSYSDAPKYSFTVKTMDAHAWKKVDWMFSLMQEGNNAGVSCSATKLRCTVTQNSGSEVTFHFVQTPDGLKLKRVELEAED